MIDWTAVGGVAGMVLTGIIGWFTGKGKREVSASQENAEISNYRADQATADANTAQVKALIDRVAALEESHRKMWDEQRADKLLIVKLQIRQAQLEGILRQHQIPVPPEN